MNSYEISGFTSASNIKSESNSRIYPNGSLVFGIDGNSQKSITSNNTCLNMAIAYLIISEGFPFNLYQKTIYKKVLELSRNTSKTYIPLNRKLISKELFDIIHEQDMKINLKKISKRKQRYLGCYF